MTALYVVARTDVEENETETFRVAYKTFEAAVAEIIGDMNSLLDDDADDGPEKVDRKNFEIHITSGGEWKTEEFFGGFYWTVTEVTLEV